MFFYKPGVTRNPRRDPRPHAQRHRRLDPARLLHIAPRGLCASSPSQPPPQTLTLIAPPCRRASAPPRAHLPAAPRPPQTPALAPHQRAEARRALARDSQALRHVNFACAAPPVSIFAASIPRHRGVSGRPNYLCIFPGLPGVEPGGPGDRRTTPPARSRAQSGAAAGLRRRALCAGFSLQSGAR